MKSLRWLSKLLVVRSSSLAATAVTCELKESARTLRSYPRCLVVKDQPLRPDRRFGSPAGAPLIGATFLILTPLELLVKYHFVLLRFFASAPWSCARVPGGGT